MKEYNVVGLGNGLVDILVRVDEPIFNSLGLKRGSSEMVAGEAQKDLLDSTNQTESVLASGGSVANSMIAIAQLGGKAAFLTSLGNDKYGQHFTEEFSQFGIKLPNQLRAAEMTGTVAILITPEGERTMRFHLGAAQRFGADSISAKEIENSQWLFIEGYLFSNSPQAVDGVQKAVQVAKAAGTKVALTLSEPWVLEHFGTPIRALLPQVDLLFANEAESCFLSGGKNAADSFKKLQTLVPNVVVTAGAHGVYVRYDHQDFHTPAFECAPVDLTGAGDMLAGAFLFGVTNGFSAQQSARGGCYLSRQIITQIGPRLAKGTREFWEQALTQGA
jgi:sugar/nucleoside kinase (ribokinase family)